MLSIQVTLVQIFEDTKISVIVEGSMEKKKRTDLSHCVSCDLKESFA